MGLSNGFRSNKKARFNSSNITLGDCSNKNFCNSSASILSVVNNKTLKNIINCQGMTVLNLHDTAIRRIRSCPLIYSITIIDNNTLEVLKLPSVIEANLHNARDLCIIDLPHAIRISIDHLPRLQQLKLPRVVNVSISNMNLCNKPTIYELFPCAEELTLTNVCGFNELERFSGLHLRKITIRNCDISTITNLEEFDEIIIENCFSLQSIEHLYDVKSLIVDNCPKLLRVEQISSKQITITRCNELLHISNIISTMLQIEYCFELMTIPSLAVDSIIIGRCPSLCDINLYHNLSQAVIDHCDSLEMIHFDGDVAFGYDKLVLKLYGSNQIIDIKDWYVSNLVIRNNSSLETIRSIYNLTELSIFDCRELVTIADVSILEDLSIESCPALETMENIYGFSNLALVDCESLTRFSMYLTELKTVIVNHCFNLNFTISGSMLEDLSLVDCGFVIITDLSYRAELEIKNARMLPDTSTSTPNILSRIGISVYQESIDLGNLMANMMYQAGVISKRLRSFTIRSRYLKFLDLKFKDELYDCAICQECVCPASSTFTRCNHVFHSSCLGEWLQIRRSCPLCVSEL